MLTRKQMESAREAFKQWTLESTGQGRYPVLISPDRKRAISAPAKFADFKDVDVPGSYLAVAVDDPLILRYLSWLERLQMWWIVRTELRTRDRRLHREMRVKAKEAIEGLFPEVAAHMLSNSRTPMQTAAEEQESMRTTPIMGVAHAANDPVLAKHLGQIKHLTELQKVMDHAMTSLGRG